MYGEEAAPPNEQLLGEFTTGKLFLLEPKNINESIPTVFSCNVEYEI